MKTLNLVHMGRQKWRPYERQSYLCGKVIKIDRRPMEIEFNGTIWHWRGPAPWFFVTIPQNQSDEIKAIAKSVTYGWGVIPVQVQIGETVWKTSLFPQESLYLVPIKAAVRKAEQLDEGDDVTIRLTVG